MRKKFDRWQSVVLVAASVLLISPAWATADVIFGYVARPDVRVLGQVVETWRVTGVVKGTDIAELQRRAEVEAGARLARKGAVVAGPTVSLCTPLVGTTETKEK